MDVETDGLDVIERLADDWRALLQREPDDDIYNRPEWILANLRAYSPDARIVVLILRHGRDLYWETHSHRNPLDQRKFAATEGSMSCRLMDLTGVAAVSGHSLTSFGRELRWICRSLPDSDCQPENR